MKNYIHALITIILIGMSQMAQAQDETVFAHYTINPVILNPAATGFDETHQILFNARAQWTSFPNAPTTVGVQYNGPIGNSFGLGVGVLTESAASLTRFRARLNSAFRFDAGNYAKLSVGFAFEFHQQTVGNNVFGDNLYEIGDDIIESIVDGRNEFDASLGVFGRFGRDLNTFAGLTLINMVRTRLDDIVVAGDNTNNSIFNHYVLLAGHNFQFDNAGFSIEPSVMIQQVMDAPFRADFNLKAGFLEDRVVAGLSYRTLGIVGILLGGELRFGNQSGPVDDRSAVNLFYTFDLSTQEFQQFTSGSHEITLAFGFNRKQKR